MFTRVETGVFESPGALALLLDGRLVTELWNSVTQYHGAATSNTKGPTATATFDALNSAAGNVTATMDELAVSCVQLMREHGFDGLEVDWVSTKVNGSVS